MNKIKTKTQLCIPLKKENQMIRRIKQNEEKIVIKFLEEFAPEQIQFIRGDYFGHGENITLGRFDKNKNKLIGCIRYCIQQIGEEQNTPPIIKNGIKLKEAKINVFAVDKDYRNQGIGKKLQLKVIEDAKINNCSQVASYSTFDKIENYSVKLGLGFCVQPETQADGTIGCFFLMKI